MAALFAGYEGALENTSKIADMCNLDFSFGKYHLPNSGCRRGTTASPI